MDLEAFVFAKPAAYGRMDEAAQENVVQADQRVLPKN